MNEKRFQVFISSTFTDLIEERRAVLQAVLELDHMPAGMELFPASDESAWGLIKGVIDRSDYYVLIVGGRYGSLDATGIGYTEKEYDYALATKKPVIPLLHQDPEKIARGKTEEDSKAWARLKKFRAKVEKAHTCSYWTTVEELKVNIILGLTAGIRRNPQIGWVRADRVPPGSSLADILALRQRVTELERELESARIAPPAGSEKLASGRDDMELTVEFEDFSGEAFTATLSRTWDEIFAKIAPYMIGEASEADMRKTLDKWTEAVVTDEFADDDDFWNHGPKRIRLARSDVQTIIIQFRALGLIRESERRRSIMDRGSYWTLTPHGDRKMVQLRAIAREEPTQEVVEAG